MKWILLATLLIGAVAAVVLIRFLRRPASSQAKDQIPLDSIFIAPPNSESAWQIPEKNAFHNGSSINHGVRINPRPLSRQSEVSGQIGEAPQKDLSIQRPSDLNVDKNVQFTVYRPNTIVPNKWYPLVAFAHLSKRRPSAPKDEPDPVEEVRRQAARLLSDQPAQYEPTKLDRGFSVPRKGHLTFVPLIEGCEFNPPTQSVLWQKTVHKVEFEMTASANVDGRDVEGQMTVYLGNIVLTEIPLRISVDSQYVAAASQPPVFEEENAEPYRKIFASYSHQDTEIVEDFEAYVQALGDQYLRDVQTLRSGEVWSEALERMIREATVFQLFWSSNSMRSKFVKQEWEYALALNKPGFIRPVYWEEPLPQVDQDLPPAELRRLHFYKFPEIIQSAPGADLTNTLPVGPASQVMPGGNLEAVPNPPAPALGPPRRSVFPMKPLLAVISFVAIGSVAFVGYLNTTKTARVPPALSLAVSTTGRLQSEGDSCEYSLVVRNTSAEIINDVRITEQLPDDLEYLTSDPEPITQEGQQAIVWRIAEIRGDQTVMIRVNVRLRRDLKPGEKVTTKETISYKDGQGKEKIVTFYLEPITRAP